MAEFPHLTRHYQVAGPPDRSEPFPSDVDFARVFKLIDETGFDGWIGCEYKPRGVTLGGLDWFSMCGVSMNG